MTSYYNQLDTAQQQRVFFAAVGRNSMSNLDSGFCQGAFPAAHDGTGDPQWAAWSAAQRDVFVFTKDAATSAWSFHCKIGMTTDDALFAPTMDALLGIGADAGSETDAGGETDTSGDTETGETGLDTQSAASRAGVHLSLFAMVNLAMASLAKSV